MSRKKPIKIRYIYQQFISHISIIIVAFLVLSLMFSHYVGNLVYENKADELLTYGKSILSDIDRNSPTVQDQILNQYSNVLSSRNISFSVFDEEARLYSVGRKGPGIELNKDEWEQVKNGKTIIFLSDYKRYDKGMTFVVLPYKNQGTFVGGILLTSPISGSSAMINQVNQFLFYAILIALGVSFLLSLLLSFIHVNRIKRLREATSLVSAGDYHVHVPSSNFDEIGELANDFNHMVKKINHSMEEIDNLENRRRQFMADVSHEMRTPLTTISGVIEGLKNDMIPEEDKERGIQLVSQEAKRLIRLVNENLDYEKIRSNQIQLYREEIQLLELFEIIQEQLSPQAEEKNVEIIVDADDSIIVYADYDRLVQILINIIKNSIQFTKNGKIWIRGRIDQKDTIIEIEDTGIGIEPSEVENIWRRFYKADLSRTTNPYGEFGLGLSIVKQLVQLHNGEIHVDSEKGKGTKFTIRFKQ